MATGDGFSVLDEQAVKAVKEIKRYIFTLKFYPSGRKDVDLLLFEMSLEKSDRLSMQLANPALRQIYYL